MNAVNRGRIATSPHQLWYTMPKEAITMPMIILIIISTLPTFFFILLKFLGLTIEQIITDNVYFQITGFLLTGIVIHLAPPPPRGSSFPSMVRTYFL